MKIKADLSVKGIESVKKKLIQYRDVAYLLKRIEELESLVNKTDTTYATVTE